jgi:hypothetical protein
MDAGFVTLRIARSFVKPPRAAIVPTRMPWRSFSCSARLQAGTLDSSTGSPEGERYNPSLLGQVAMHDFGGISLFV